MDMADIVLNCNDIVMYFLSSIASSYIPSGLEWWPMTGWSFFNLKLTTRHIISFLLWEVFPSWCDFQLQTWGNIYISWPRVELDFAKRQFFVLYDHNSKKGSILTFLLQTFISGLVWDKPRLCLWSRKPEVAPSVTFLHFSTPKLIHNFCQSQFADSVRIPQSGSADSPSGLPAPTTLPQWANLVGR